MEMCCVVVEGASSDSHVGVPAARQPEKRVGERRGAEELRSVNLVSMCLVLPWLVVCVAESRSRFCTAGVWIEKSPQISVASISHG